MIVLAFDTAMAGCSAALFDTLKQEVLSERFIAMSKGHADAIAPLIHEIMGEAKLEFGELGLIGATTGPGTFTGVRTGMAMGRGLALSLGIPMIGMDTLSAIACNIQHLSGSVAVAVDARRGEIYFALFDRDLTMMHEPAVLLAEDAAGRLPDGVLNVLGTGAEALIDAAPGKAVIKSSAGDLPRASVFISRVAAMKPDAAAPEPLYLRPPDAKPQERFAGIASAFTISPAPAEAANLLTSLYAECFDNPWSAADMARLVAMPGAIALVASEEGEPCAFLIARQAADEAEIIALGTRPFARRQGAARALVERLQAEILEKNARAIFIEVASSNEPGRRLYRGLGFISAGTRENYYEKPGGRREDAIVMRKDLIR
jgi:tRNA threonylcarbamoyladenosine biosynthesis protein TsaB